MKHATPHPHADLWTKARELLAAFTLAWGEARAIALKWTMFEEHVAEALKALAPVEALARRLVFAEALTIKLKPAVPRRIVVCKPKHVSPFTIITLDPLAFRKSLSPPPFVHLKPPHPLEQPPEDWRVRFTVAQFGARTFTPPKGCAIARAVAHFHDPKSARPPPEPGWSRGNPIRIAESRRERRRRARQAAEDAWRAHWWGDPNAPRNTLDATPTWKVPERISTGALARRTEALQRVIEAPTRYARALARRIAKHVAQVPRIVRRLSRRGDAPCVEAMQCIYEALPAFADTS